MSIIIRTYDLSPAAADGFFVTAINAPDDDCVDCDDSSGGVSTVGTCPSMVLLQNDVDNIVIEDGSNIDVGALAECDTDVKEFEKIISSNAGYSFSIFSTTFSQTLNNDAIRIQDCGISCVIDLSTGVITYGRKLRFTLLVLLLPTTPYTITVTIKAKECGGFNPVTLVTDYVTMTFDIFD